MKRLIIIAIVWICHLSNSVWAQDQTITIPGPPRLLSEDAARLVNTNDATLNLEDAEQLIALTLGNRALRRPDSYCIIHILKWKDNQTSVETQHWYLYHNGKWSKKQFEELRIFGAKNVSLLYVHLNARGVPSPTPSQLAPNLNLTSVNGRVLTNMGTFLLESDYSRIVYKINVTKKLPAPILDLKALVGIAQGEQPRVQQVSPIHLWGGQVMTIDHLPSDVTVITLLGETLDQKEIGKQTYDNEGRYYWDVSVGLPVTKVKELSFNADDGTVRAKEIDRQKLFAFFNFYPKPIDTKGTKLLKFPHLVAGVALSKKPLDRIFVGGGWGFNKVHFFAGVAFNKIESPQALATGAMATPAQLNADLKSRYQPKFIFGLDLPVRQVVDALKGKK